MQCRVQLSITNDILRSSFGLYCRYVVMILAMRGSFLVGLTRGRGRGRGRCTGPGARLFIDIAAQAEHGWREVSTLADVIYLTYTRICGQVQAVTTPQTRHFQPDQTVSVFRDLQERYPWTRLQPPPPPASPPGISPSFWFRFAGQTRAPEDLLECWHQVRDSMPASSAHNLGCLRTEIVPGNLSVPG